MYTCRSVLYGMCWNCVMEWSQSWNEMNVIEFVLLFKPRCQLK